MDRPEPDTDASVILQGELSDQLDMSSLLKLIAEQPKVPHGILKINSGKLKGLIAIHNGDEIIGALTKPDNVAGIEALQKLFGATHGDYIFVKVDEQSATLNQPLKLSIDKLFVQMNRALSKGAERTPALPPAARRQKRPLRFAQGPEVVGRRDENAAALPLPDHTQPIPLAAIREETGKKAPAQGLKLAVLALGVLLSFVLFWQTSGAMNGKMHFSAGLAALLQGAPDLAVKEFSQAVAGDPDLRQAYLYRAIAYSRQGDAEHAIADYTEVLMRDPDNLRALIGRASQYLRSKDYEKARDDCDAVLKHDARSSDALRIRAIALACDGKYDKAVNDCREYMRICGDHAPKSEKADMFAVQAAARMKADEFGAAIDDYSKAIALDPRSNGLYLGRATAFKVAGDWQNALNDCNKSIELGAGWDAYQLRGLCHQALKELAPALADLSMAIKLSPADAKLYRQRADIELAAGKFSQACDDYGKALQWTPNDPGLRSRYNFALGKLPGAKHGPLLAQLEPDNSNEPPPDPGKYRGDAATLTKTGYELMQKGSSFEAVLALSAAVKADPNNQPARRYLAHAFVLAGKPASAAQQFAVLSKLVQLDEVDLLSWAHALEQAGQATGAAEVYERCLAVRADNKEARLALVEFYSAHGFGEKAEKAALDGIAASSSPADQVFFQAKARELNEARKNRRPVNGQADNQT